MDSGDFSSMDMSSSGESKASINDSQAYSPSASEYQSESVCKVFIGSSLG